MEPEAIHAVVTLPPGIAGETIFAVQSPDGTSGTFVRAYGKSPLPPLARGDSIKLLGTLVTEDDASLFHTRGTWITVEKSSVEPGYHKRTPSELSPSDAGVALEINGLVSARGKRWIDVSETDGSKEIRLETPTDLAPAATPGDSVKARGVARIRAGKISLLVAAASDIVISPSAPLEPAKNDLKVKKRSEEPERTGSGFGRIVIPPIMIVALVWRWYSEKRRREDERGSIDS